MHGTVVEPDSLALQAQVDEAGRLLSEDDDEGAVALLAPLIASEETSLAARFLLAMAAWKAGRLDAAIELMRACHEQWPMDGSVAEALASLYAQAGNFEDSLFMAKLGAALGGPGKLSNLQPKRFPVFDTVFYRFRDKPMLAQARAAITRGEVSLAIEYVRQHSAINPSDGDSHALLALLLFRAGMASTANEVLCSIVEHMDAGGEVPTSCVSLHARVSTAVGRFEQARALHERATAEAPADSAIAAARIADGGLLDVDPATLASWSKDWAQRFCAAPKPRQWRRVGGKLAIGYIVSAFADPLDIAAVAAAARAHDRNRVTVVGFGMGAQNWDENALFGGAFDKWQDIGSLDPATLARFFDRAGLHLIVDTAGFASPNSLVALSRLQTAIRVSWLGNPATLGAPVYDVHVAGVLPKAREAHWPLGGGYPIIPSAQPMAAVSSRDDFHFGVDARMSQIDDETVALWTKVLEAKPAAKLLLRSRDMARGANIDRLIGCFGRVLAARVDVVDVETPAEFYASIDVALMPCRGVSPRAAAEALAHGVPPVTLGKGKGTSPYAPFLRGLGIDASLVSSTEAGYVKIAVNLATSREARKELVAGLKTAVEAGAPHHFARALEERAMAELASAEMASP